MISLTAETIWFPFTVNPLKGSKKIYNIHATNNFFVGEIMSRGCAFTNFTQINIPEGKLADYSTYRCFEIFSPEPCNYRKKVSVRSIF